MTSRPLAPKRLVKEELRNLPINLLVGHIKSHEEFARKYMSTKEKYKKYYEQYLSDAYRIVYNKDYDGFILELQIARVEQIPFYYKMQKGY